MLKHKINIINTMLIFIKTIYSYKEYLSKISYSCIIKILIEINSDIISFQWFLEERVKVTSWTLFMNQINVRLFSIKILNRSICYQNSELIYINHD